MRGTSPAMLACRMAVMRPEATPTRPWARGGTREQSIAHLPQHGSVCDITCSARVSVRQSPSDWRCARQGKATRGSRFLCLVRTRKDRWTTTTTMCDSGLESSHPNEKRPGIHTHKSTGYTRPGYSMGGHPIGPHLSRRYPVGGCLVRGCPVGGYLMRGYLSCKRLF